MGYLLRMAVRNVWRNRRRSVLAMISVAMASLLCLFLQGLLGAFQASLVKNFTKNESGHVRITTKDFFQRSDLLPVDAMIPDPQAVEAKLRTSADVAGKISLITERISFGVLLENRGMNKNALALAGEPRTEESLLYLQRSIQPGGRYIDGPGQTIIGAELADDLKLTVGDRLKVVSQASDGSLQLKKFLIAGVFKTGVSTLDGRVFQIPIQDAKAFLRTGTGAQSIIIMLNDYHDAGSVAARIRALLPDAGLAVTPWTEIGDYGRLMQLEEKIFNVLFVVILFLGAFIITNIMTMVVLERRREIGVLKSMGFGRGEVLVLFLWEGVILGVWGSVIGGGLGFLINVALHFKGVDFTSYFRALEFPLDNVLYWAVDVPVALGVVVLGCAISGLVSVVPSLRAARMNAVDAIKSV
ncbi:MAG TPA: FtsX-like permease family protein [Spirochaetia bacterium]|nr:FtsX-like permease family protein [Spirochaetia bacterium]